MPDFSTLQQIDQGQYAPPPAVAAAPTSAALPVSSWLPPGLPQPSDDIAVVGPSTAAQWQTNPPAPPSPTLKGQEAQDAVDTYATYLNWRREQAAAPGSKSAQTPLALVTSGTTPAGALANGGQASGGVQVGTAVPKPTDDFMSRLAAVDAATEPSFSAPASGGLGSAAAKSAPVSPTSDAGLVGNFAAGANRNIAATLGAPVDLVTGALNLIPRGINAAVGSDLPTIKNPVGGSSWLMSAMGLLGADPRNVVPQGLGENLAQGAGAGMAGAIVPMGAAGQLARAVDTIGPVAAGVARSMAEAPPVMTAAAAAAGGLMGAAATDAARASGVPEKYVPLIDMAGNVLGGAGAAAATAGGMLAARGIRAAYQGATSALPVGEAQPILDANGVPIAGANGQPVTARQNTIDNAAATAARRAGMSSGDLSDALGASAPNVPGAQPTAGQLTGNRGLLGLERKLQTVSEAAREAFSDRRVAQNNAQIARLATLAPEDAQAQAAANYFVNRLNQIDAQEAAAKERLEAAYRQRLAEIKGQAHPSDIGAAMQGHVASARAPAVAAADTAVERGEQAVDFISRAIGGEVGSTDSQTAIQAMGQSLREAVAAVEKHASIERRRLYAARDPDGKLAISGAPISDAAKALRKEFNSDAGDKMTPREDELIGVAEKMSGVVPMAKVSAFRKNINGALKEATAGQNVGAVGAAEAVRRLTILKQAVDQAELEATERAAAKDGTKVVSGQAPPDATVAGRLAVHAAGGDTAAPGTGSAVFTPSGRRIDVGYRVVEASSLKGSHDADMAPNPQYPAELQPRDRTRAASAAQVQRIAGNLQPERLGASASADQGAPIVGPDGVVESGNARYLAVRQAHAHGGEQAAAYRQYLADQGYDVSRMKEPILVRERLTPLSPEDRVKFTQEANAPAGLALSATERARIDASRLPDDSLALFRPGDVTTAANRDFVRSFMQHAIEKGEEGSIMTRDGGLSLEGAQRIRNALLHKAYGDSSLVSALAESGEDNIKAFGGALMDAAGPMARLRTQVQSGRVTNAVDITQALVDAAKAIAQARQKGIALRDYVAQQDILGGGVSERTAELLRAAYGEHYAGRMSRQKLAAVLSDYADEALKQSTEARLFGDNASSSEILGQAVKRNAAAGKSRTVQGQPALFGTSGSRNEENGNAVRRSVDDATGQGNSGQAGNQGSPLQENLTAEDAARFKAADAFNRAYMQRFGPKTPAGQVLARGPGGDFKMALSNVAKNLWKSGPLGAETSQNLEAAFGSKEAAERAIGDYAAYDLKAYAGRGASLDSAKLNKWLDDHAAALNAFPGLRQRFNTLKAAQAALDELRKARAAIEASNPIKPGELGATTLQQFVKPGPKGGEAVDAYFHAAGDTPATRETLGDAFAYALRSETMKDGELTPKDFAAFKAKYASALDRVPEIARQFEDVAAARQSVDEAAAQAAQDRKAYLDSVVGHYLTKGGEPIEPMKAVDSIMRSPTGPADVMELKRLMAGDRTALEGLQRNFAEWISRQVKNTAEAGSTGESEISTAKLQRIVDNSATMAILRRAMTSDQIDALLELAKSARMSARSHNATKIPGSPASAADLRASHTSDPHADVTGALLAETGGELLGHLLGLGPVMNLLVRGGAIAGRIYYGSAKTAGIQTANDLLTEMSLNPALMRAVLAAARQKQPSPVIMRRIGGMLGNLAIASATAPPPPRIAAQQ